MEQFLLITSPTEPNIGILRITDEKVLESPDFQSKLKDVLEEYYGYTVCINSVLQTDFTFIEIKAQVTIGVDAQNVFSETISLNETRIY